MVKWLVAADDFTGALDVAVQFTKNGYKVLVTTNVDFDFSACPGDVQILVVDTETRHLLPKEAYQVIFKLVGRAVQAGVQNVLKKTDSALRGNVGSELEAASRAAGGSPVIFAPAFPKMGRTTVDGIHYMGGVPIHESVYGQDPFEPVRFSYLEQIIRSQSDLQVLSLDAEDLPGTAAENTVYAINARTDADLAAAAQAIFRQPVPRLAAGCAGLAEQIGASSPGMECKGWKPHPTNMLIIISGSVSPISLAQTKRAGECGYLVYTLRPEQKLADYGNPENREKLEQELANLLHNRQNRHIVIQAAADSRDLRETDELALKSGLQGEELRRRISSAIGILSATCFKLRPEASYMFVGGDTCRAFMEATRNHELVPVLELLPGIVLSLLERNGHTVQILSKSGGFGEDDTLIKITKLLQWSDYNG